MYIKKISKLMDEKLVEAFSSFDGKEEELIPLLQKAQDIVGFLSEEVMSEIAKFTKVPGSKVFGVATFYSQFRFNPIGKTHITVCRGTACHVRGSGKILDNIEKTLGISEGEVTDDMKYSIETVACIGACGLAPCMMVNKKIHAKMTPKKSDEIFKKQNGK